MADLNYFKRTGTVALSLAALTIAGGAARADFVINDDLIVDGSACIGFDCVNGEAFGFDTIKLKENNLRIKFDDTSVAASYPRNDWQLTANDSTNGGVSKFSIDDITNNRTPFTVEANARSHSLYVDDGGRIGSRTSTPAVEFHTIDGDSPTVRLQQDGSSGFAPQTWDIAGNETNFFVRDTTNGSLLPFRIRPGAPTSSIFIDVDGDVGFGTSSPLGPVHIIGDGSARQMVVLEQTTAGTVWTLANYETGAGEGAGNFGINQVGGGNRFLIDTSGNVKLPALPSCSGGIQTAADGQLSCIVSSARYKRIDGYLTAEAALENVMSLRPQIGAYSATPNEPEHWLIAEEVAAVDPALVGRHNGKPYTVKTQNVVANLVAAIQLQQQSLEKQQARIKVLEKRIVK